MSDYPRNAWQPTADDVATSNVKALIDRLGVKDYDALLAFSNAQPDAYWKTVLDFCGIVWDVPCEAYVDASAGPQFPKWFPGGQLNWVKSALKWADDPSLAAGDAVVAEREDGSVQRVSYADLSARVAALAGGLKAHGVQRGDRVGLLLENGIEATVSVL